MGTFTSAGSGAFLRSDTKASEESSKGVHHLSLAPGGGSDFRSTLREEGTVAQKERTHIVQENCSALHSEAEFTNPTEWPRITEK